MCSTDHSDLRISGVHLRFLYFVFFVLFCGYSGLSYLCAFASLREIFLCSQLSHRLSDPV